VPVTETACPDCAGDGARGYGPGDPATLHDNNAAEGQTIEQNVIYWIVWM